MKKLYKTPMVYFESIETEDVLLESIDLPEGNFNKEAPVSKTDEP